jgi:hypothetical protein
MICALFDYVAKQLNRFGLAYLHSSEPRMKGNVLIAEGQGHIATVRLREVLSLIPPRPLFETRISSLVVIRIGYGRCPDAS